VVLEIGLIFLEGMRKRCYMTGRRELYELDNAQCGARDVLFIHIVSLKQFLHKGLTVPLGAYHDVV
jgi:hypothetical protein